MLRKVWAETEDRRDVSVDRREEVAEAEVEEMRDGARNASLGGSNIQVGIRRGVSIGRG